MPLHELTEMGWRVCLTCAEEVPPSLVADHKRSHDALVSPLELFLLLRQAHDQEEASARLEREAVVRYLRARASVTGGSDASTLKSLADDMADGRHQRS